MAAAQCSDQEILVDGLLGLGLELGLDTSGNQTDWLTVEQSSIVMRYPSGQQWGAVFITYGPSVPPGSRPGSDLSSCQNLVLEVSGDPGTVQVGLKDSLAADDGTEKKVSVQVTNEWQTVSIPLASFVPTNLTDLYVLTEFVFEGAVGRTLRVRNIAFSSRTVLPQFAFGGGWYSAVYFANTSDQSRTFNLEFLANDGGPLGGSPPASVNLSPQGTAFVEAPDSGSLKEGYVLFSLPPGVVGYGLFRQSISGRADQEAVVPLSNASAKRSTLIWDDTVFVTAVAIVNASPMIGTVTITARDTAGQIIGTSTVVLAAGAKKAVVLKDLPGLSAMGGKRGSAEFNIGSGGLAVLGLRFGGQAFTSIPVAAK